MEHEVCIMNYGLWTTDYSYTQNDGLWIMDHELWPMGYGLWPLDAHGN